MLLLAAARLRVGGRRLRALARGDMDAVARFVQSDSAVRLAEARRDARADLARLQDVGARLVVYDDAEYPPGLRELRDPPAFLAVRGVLPAGGIAVVGSRDAHPRALAFARDVVVRLGRPLVSGLARGIDGAAHEAAVARGLAQVAYVGTGIAQTFPPEHAALAEAIVAGGGALASESFPDDPMSPWAIRRRDRLQAAHASAVLLVTSETDGGAMFTMDVARRLGRPRFACAPDDAAAGAGNRYVIQQSARAVPWDAEAAALRISSIVP